MSDIMGSGKVKENCTDCLQHVVIEEPVFSLALCVKCSSTNTIKVLIVGMVRRLCSASCRGHVFFSFDSSDLNQGLPLSA